jgi:hypothetical protein
VCRQLPCDGLITRPREFCRLCEEEARVEQKGLIAIDERVNELMSKAVHISVPVIMLWGYFVECLQAKSLQILMDII